MPNTVVDTYSMNINTHKPSHPKDFQVIRQGNPDSFSSKLVAMRAYPKGSVVAPLNGLTAGEKRYTSVQLSENKHIELNSDLVFMNHSCDPSTHMDVDQAAVIALRDIAAGDELTFFYPSTEWDMAQPFSCWCKSKKCVSTVNGAKYLSTEVLNQFPLSNHIKKLAKERDSVKA
ncbi:hypothetical protein BDB01DRAFT_798876 [Pilobolus umbonatus]|nr:hypothetical protein BDB01DRAFT_798876 [Pilobolus umbonatus]